MLDQAAPPGMVVVPRRRGTPETVAEFPEKNFA
jgi:hypothetical protein